MVSSKVFGFCEQRCVIEGEHVLNRALFACLVIVVEDQFEKLLATVMATGQPHMQVNGVGVRKFMSLQDLL